VAHAEPAPPNLDSAPAIAVRAGNKVFLVGKVSTGVQIYKCNGTASVFDHPEATLVGDKGKGDHQALSPGRRGRRRTAARRKPRRRRR
jgi:hypothetical protein